MDIKEKLMLRKVINEAGCWVWTGYVTNHGYGQVGIGDKLYLVHRLAAKIWKDFNIDSPLLVCHKCDNRKCFNPEHLFIGTDKDNLQDAGSKGKMGTYNKSKTRCPRGHEYSSVYTKPDGKTQRICGKCEHIKSLKRTATGRKWLEDNHVS